MAVLSYKMFGTEMKMEKIKVLSKAVYAGFEHSIANMFYFNLAGVHSLRSFAYLFVMAAGNGIGAKLFAACIGSPCSSQGLEN